ncbi:MauE/DoxX family redox-associated membrane protein [Demequina sp.]|uniref:MauE/DoxX family redox-associated membrane protein n=1 Tax=Demequina sp. TaxID=2050685 RepID=UPI003D0A2EB0
MAVKKSEVFEWISTVVRLAMAGILIAAAIPKIQDIPQSIIAVRAYRLLPEPVVPFVGTMLPFVELLLALFLILGLFTRIAAIVWLAMMAAFMFGVIWAWAKGYSIDCGCFGGGGDVAEGTTNYPMHMLERVGFVILGAWLLVYPRTKFSLDGWMRGGN